MSFDIRICIDTGTQLATIGDPRNVTGNLYPILNKAAQAAGLEGFRTLDGMQCSVAIDLLVTMQNDMLLKRAEYTLLEPSNGWGTLEHGIGVVRWLLDMSVDHPKAQIEIGE